MPWHRPVGELKADQSAAGGPGGPARGGALADEGRLVDGDGPAEVRVIGRGGRIHVRAIQPKAGLQSQGIAGTQAGRHDVLRPSPFERLCPDALGVQVRQEHFEPVAAGAAGPRHPGLGPERRNRDHVKSPQATHPHAQDLFKQGAGSRALHGHNRSPGADVAHLHGPAPMRLHPLDVAGAPGAIDNDEAVLTVEAIDDDVIQNAALLVQEHGVAGPPRADIAHVAHRELIQGLQGSRPADPHLSHVGDIEHPGAGSHGLMLFEDAGVVERHLPAMEVRHLGVEGTVEAVQCRLVRRHLTPAFFRISGTRSSQPRAYRCTPSATPRSSLSNCAATATHSRRASPERSNRLMSSSGTWMPQTCSFMYRAILADFTSRRPASTGLWSPEGATRARSMNRRSVSMSKTAWV